MSAGKTLFVLAAAFWMGPVFALAGSIEPEVIPAKKAFEHGEPVTGVFRLPEEVPARGLTLRARVSDTLGRLLFDADVPLPATDTVRDIPFELNPPSVTAFRHIVRLSLRRRGRDVHTAAARIIIKPPAGWDDFVVMIWQRHNPVRWDRLQEDGIRCIMWSPYWEPADLVDHGVRNYIDNAVTKFYSPYHVWMPDRDKTYYFKLYMDAFKKDRTNRFNFIRTPSLADPMVLRMLDRQCALAAQRQRDTAPLWYSLADEPGIANQAAPSDFDWHVESLRDFRIWLKEQYKTLDAVNAQYGTAYTDWDGILPMTNDEGIAAACENPSRWVDFKDYMDTQMCRAYRLGTDSIRRYDKGAHVGIGGVQGPEAVGCWDFYKMAKAMDTFETYYIGNNAELLRSLRSMGNPLKLIYSHFGGSDMNMHYEWYLFLHGADSCLIWDDKSDWVDDAGERSERARKMTPMHIEQVNGLGMQLLHSHPVDDPVGVYFSMASLRTHWVREIKDTGEDWAERNSWTERTRSMALKRRLSWVFLLEDSGLQYKFIFDEQVRAEGAVRNHDPLDDKPFRLLVLPSVIAASPAEVEAVRDFVAAGGTVVADGLLGLTDSHGRPVAENALAELFGVKETAAPKAGAAVTKAESDWANFALGMNILSSGLKVTAEDASILASTEDGTPAVVVREHPGGGRTFFLNLDVIDYYRQRGAPGKDEPAKSFFAQLFDRELASVRRAPRIFTPDGRLPQGVEVHQWQNGSLRFVSVIRNPLQRAKELGGIVHTEAGPLDVDTPLEIRNIPGIDNGEIDVYDTRAGGKLEGAFPAVFMLKPFEPAVFTVVPKGYVPGEPRFPSAVRPPAPCNVIFPSPASGGEEIYHVYVAGPDGVDVWRYGGNVSVKSDGPTTFTVPFALNDPKGRWALRIRHVPTGREWSAPLVVR
ncbi:MAG: beta-galactosidase [Planctomycetes bacterium]|nr:beta-galactosidase [Planctomycetota bacterium]